MFENFQFPEDLAWVILLLPLLAVYKTASISRAKERQSLHDALTDLPNRVLIQQRLSHGTSRATVA